MRVNVTTFKPVVNGKCVTVSNFLNMVLECQNRRAALCRPEMVELGEGCKPGCWENIDLGVSGDGSRDLGVLDDGSLNHWD